MKLAGNTTALNHGLQRRQALLPDQCSSQCVSVFDAIYSCIEDSCACPTFLADGPVCASCLATVNITVASIISSGVTFCQTGSITTTPCSSECELITKAAWQCVGEACYCSVLLAEGPGCSQCWASLNGTDASFYGDQITACGSEYPAIPTGSNSLFSGFPDCYDWCHPIGLAAETCPSASEPERCYCQIVLGAGSQCSECWAPANTAEASFVGSLFTQCQTDILPYPRLVDHLNDLCSTATDATSGPVVIGPASPQSSTASIETYGVMLLYVTMFLGALAGLFCVLF